MDLKSAIRSVPDFPKKGIVFRDITTLLKDKSAFKHSIDLMQNFCKGKKVDKILGIESRGFIFGGVLADRLGVGFVPIRKKGKLPAKTVSQEYQLEYGSDSIEIHADALSAGDSALIVDDLIATGGTLAAACHLVEKNKAKVAGIACLIELTFLGGRKKLPNYDIFSLIKYDSE
jgi:adenine phosphoribosyltransferase